MICGYQKLAIISVLVELSEEKMNFLWFFSADFLLHFNIQRHLKFKKKSKGFLEKSR